MGDDTSLIIGVIIIIIIIIILIWALASWNNGNCSDSDSETESNWKTQQYKQKVYKRLNNSKTGIRRGRHNRKKLSSKMASGTSNNWSGYVAATDINNPQTNSCTMVQGSFKVPTLDNGDTQNNNNVSIWVGIDGAFASAPTVEQLGVDLSRVNGQTQTYVWYEMYPDYAYQLVDFPANAGDQITTTVTYDGSNFNLTISNDTQGAKANVKKSANSSYKMQSVEWIVEAPALGNDIVPLASFSPITWYNCTATVNGQTGNISQFSNESVNMVASNGSVKATTSNLNGNGDTFTVTWHGD
jgi:hypothetical protein